MADPLVLVLGALASVTSGLTILFRLLMTEKDKSYARLEKDCTDSTNDLKADNAWLKGQLAELQQNQIATLGVISKAVENQGAGVAAIGTGVHSILDLLQSTIRSER